MSGGAGPYAIGPATCAAWRATTLGAVTEALELRATLDRIGDPRSVRILDAGCGDGALACALARRGAEVTGVDAEPSMIEAARARAARDGVPAKFVKGQLERLPFADAAFDVVSATAVLCFLSDIRGALSEMARVVRPGGALVIGEPGRWSPWAAIRRCRGWLGSKTWRAARFRDASELGRLATDAGLSVVMVRGSIFYPAVGRSGAAHGADRPLLARMTTVGAAFVALKAVKMEAMGGCA